MCGICGIIGRSNAEPAHQIYAMMERMPHRGPDGSGVWQSPDGIVTLGHVRLAIVDTSDAGAQPMHNKSGIHAVTNGEFYNYPILRRSLEKDVEFFSHCDSEIILHGYERHGASYLSQLNGMFALALYDERKRTLILARDRIGIKPLYYTVYKNQLLFASEIKALFGAIPQDSWTIDRQGLSEYLTYQTPLGDNTLFCDVKQVLPGHAISIHIDHPEVLEQKPFWRSEPHPDFSLNFKDASRAFDQTFEASVQRHLLSDVPVASYLSAGFDSASVFNKASQHYGHLGQSDGLAAFTGRFGNHKGDWYDETGPAGILACEHGRRHHIVDINPDGLRENLDPVIDALDEPRMGMGAFSQFMVAKEAARDFKVILTGHGGDELFSGYPVFSYAQNGVLGFNKFSELPQFAYFFLSRFQKHYAPEAGRGLPVLWSVAQQARLLGMDRRQLKPWQQLDALIGDASSPSDAILKTYLHVYLPGLLIVEDKISMAHALESRTPFLDNQLIDLSLSIPHPIKLQGRVLKAIIKHHAQHQLPATYLDQPKRGFPTPLRFWLRNELSDMVEARLNGKETYLSTIFDPDVVRQFVSGYQHSVRKYVRPLDEIQSHGMWQLLSLESWLRIWSDKYGVRLKMA